MHDLTSSSDPIHHFHRCTTVNSPLATTVTGQLKDILTTGLGMVMFADVRFGLFNTGALVVGLGGGMLYSAVAYVETHAQTKRAVLPEYTKISPAESPRQATPLHRPLPLIRWVLE